MSDYIQAPPKERGLGCFGRGCLLISAFFVLLLIAFVIGFYAGTKPKPLPPVPTSEEQQKEVKERWDEFESTARTEPVSNAATPAPAPAPTAAAGETPAMVTPANPNRIELTAGDINQLIAMGRHTRDKAFVSIDNDVARVQLSVPLDKMGFRGRSLNGSFAVRSSPDHSPRNLQISEMSFAGMPDAMLNSIISAYPVQSHVDEFVSKYGITSFSIENGKIVLETSGGVPIPR